MNAKSLPAIAACCVLLSPALAQTTDPAQPAKDSLRGPAVPESIQKTLVHSSMIGDFQRLEGRPETAAVLLLDLDEATTRRITEVIDARDMAIAMLLIEQIDAVKEISDAIIAEETDRAGELQLKLWATFEPDAPRSPLLTPLAEVLDTDQLAEVQRLCDEYWQALIDWQTRNRKKTTHDRTKAIRDRVEKQLAFRLFQREIRIGYEATLRRYHDAMDAIYQAVEPTDAQREQMRAILIDHIRTTKLTATPAHRRAATRAMYDLLDEDRRGLLFDYLLIQVVPDAR